MKFRSRAGWDVTIHARRIIKNENFDKKIYNIAKFHIDTDMFLSVTLIDTNRSLSVSIIDRVQNFTIFCKYFSLFENVPKRNV